MLVNNLNSYIVSVVYGYFLLLVCSIKPDNLQASGFTPGFNKNNYTAESLKLIPNLVSVNNIRTLINR